jgi:DNA invertase Pin-like site-specific DNA recombinase
MDRIARGKPAIFETIIDLIGSAGVALYSVVDGLLTDNEADDEFQRADKTMTLGIKMNVLRAEKRKLVERMKRGKVRAKEAGKRTAGEYFYGTDPRRPGEVATLARMRQLKVEGLTCYGIAKRLDAEGLKPRKAEKWSPNGVQQILERVVTRLLCARVSL